MTLVRRYECNLCRGSIEKDEIEINTKQGRAGIGVYFGPSDTLIRKRLVEVEHHICMPCAREIEKIMKAIKPE